MDISVLEDLLCEVIVEKAEQVSAAKALLEDIEYIDRSQIEHISRCTMLDTEYFDMCSSIGEEDRIYITFEMPFVLDTWNDKKQRIFNITAVAFGKCSIPDERVFDYAAHDFGSMNRKELLQYRDIVDVLKLSYSDIEVNS